MVRKNNGDISHDLLNERCVAWTTAVDSGANPVRCERQNGFDFRSACHVLSYHRKGWANKHEDTFMNASRHNLMTNSEYEQIAAGEYLKDRDLPNTPFMRGWVLGKTYRPRFSVTSSDGSSVITADDIARARNLILNG